MSMNSADIIRTDPRDWSALCEPPMAFSIGSPTNTRIKNMVTPRGNAT